MSAVMMFHGDDRDAGLVKIQQLSKFLSKRVWIFNKLCKPCYGDVVLDRYLCLWDVSRSVRSSLGRTFYSLTHSNNQSQSPTQSINQSLNHSITHSINHSLKQSINHSLTHPLSPAFRWRCKHTLFVYVEKDYRHGSEL